jgi:hypothetical protein
MKELFGIYNLHMEKSKFKDNEVIKVTLKSFTDKFNTSSPGYLSKNHYKSGYLKWLQDREEACEKTIKEHLSECLKETGYTDNDIIAKYLQYSKEGHRLPFKTDLITPTANAKWEPKDKTFFNNISNKIIKENIWEVFSASRFTPDSKSKDIFLKNITTDNKSTCIRYKYYKDFIEARDKKCVEIIKKGLKASAETLKSQYPNYTLPTDENKMVELYLAHCGSDKVPFQEKFDEVKNSLKEVKEKENKFFDDVFKHIATAKIPGETTGWNTYNPIGYIKENPFTTAAAVGALGVGAWAYNNYRNRSSKKRDNSSSSSSNASSSSSNASQSDEDKSDSTNRNRSNSKSNRKSKKGKSGSKKKQKK